MAQKCPRFAEIVLFPLELCNGLESMMTVFQEKTEDRAWEASGGKAWEGPKRTFGLSQKKAPHERGIVANQMVVSSAWS